MYLWKLISVPFYSKGLLNAEEINDVELKNQLDKLKLQCWEWEVVEMVGVKNTDTKLIDFFMYLKCQVIPFPIFKLGFYCKP